MSYETKKTYESDPFKRENINVSNSRNIFYGEVISVDDSTDGGRIKVRIPNIDNKTSNDELPDAYPMLPKFFHIYPKIGEEVRIFIEDNRYMQRGRFWLGSIISQPHKIGFDSIFTALSTTNIGATAPDQAPSTYPDAVGVFPNIEDVALIGRTNTDIILRTNDLELRAGKHEDGDILKLNKKNPSSIRLTFQQNSDNTDFTSYNVLMADKIALISHSGVPKFKSNSLNDSDREKLFSDGGGHPIPRGDTLVAALEIIRRALMQHIHPHATLPADKSNSITDLKKIDFNAILQNNIVIN
jgi:hypothetical protein